MTLPAFDVADYAALVERLLSTGWTTAPVSAMPDGGEHVAYLRHDVDFHLAKIDAIARAESELGVAATYYVLLTGPYNALDAANRARLDALLGLGHEIGLHYDLTTYPADPTSAAEHLAWEVGVLEHLTGVPLTTICMHQPSLGGDMFRTGTRYVHPHDPAHADGLMYVSDSCRAWRDESLLDCFSDSAPSRLLLNTHAELWLDGTIAARMRYLDEVVAPNVVESGRTYVDEVVRELWLEHPGGARHDARVQESSLDADGHRSSPKHGSLPST